MSRRLLHTPLASRALVIFGLVGAGLAATMVMAACGTHHDATGFCAAIEQGHSAFDSTDPAHAGQALAEFDRVVATAPPSIAPDLRTIGSVIRDPKLLARDPALIKPYFASIGRVDRYLHDTCGLGVPPAVKVF